MRVTNDQPWKMGKTQAMDKMGIWSPLGMWSLGIVGLTGGDKIKRLDVVAESGEWGLNRVLGIFLHAIFFSFHTMFERYYGIIFNICDNQFHFTDEKTEAQRNEGTPKGREQLGGARICIYICLNLISVCFSPRYLTTEMTVSKHLGLFRLFRLSGSLWRINFDIWQI